MNKVLVIPISLHCPAPADGLKFLKSLDAPYRHLGVEFVPTGGVNAGNMMEYLSSDFVLAVGGTWVAKRDGIATGNWDKVVSNYGQVRKQFSEAQS